MTISDGSDEPLRGADLVATGGTWGGLLFDNPRLGLPTELTWSFDFEFRDIDRDWSTSSLGVTIGRVPLPGATWSSIAPSRARCLEFAEPIESSVYYYSHHRFDVVALELVEQRGLEVRARATLQGDIDGLGLEAVKVDSWLRFTGIQTSLTESHGAEETAAELRRFTDTTGLTQHDRGSDWGFIFLPT